MTLVVTPERDGKLAELRQLIEHKVGQPTWDRDGCPNRKLLVFTAFVDTARNLYGQIAPWARRELGIHVALIVGDGGNQTTLGGADYDDILTNFSPRAKRRTDQPRFPQSEEIDLLMATDCISEGQNLQDCGRLVNILLLSFVWFFIGKTISGLCSRRRRGAVFLRPAQGIPAAVARTGCRRGQRP